MPFLACTHKLSCAFDPVLDDESATQAQKTYACLKLNGNLIELCAASVSYPAVECRKSNNTHTHSSSVSLVSCGKLQVNRLYINKHPYEQRSLGYGSGLYLHNEILCLLLTAHSFHQGPLNKHKVVKNVEAMVWNIKFKCKCGSVLISTPPWSNITPAKQVALELWRFSAAADREQRTQRNRAKARCR